MSPGAGAPGEPVHTRIVLIGGGHTHVHVLHGFGMQPMPGVALTLIAKEVDAPYSGMLPGYVAGHYSHAQCHIDLVRLAHFAGARLIHGEANGIDRRRKRVHVAGRVPVGYDLLSIDTGITPDLAGIAGAAEHVVPVKPVSTFAPRWEALRARALAPGGPRRIAVVGTGAAGFELILAMRHRLLAEAPAHAVDPASFRFLLIGSGDLLPSHNARARALAQRSLAEARVDLITQATVVAVSPIGVRLADGRLIETDAVLVTTGAAPPAWFAATDLPRDERGFLAVRPTLQLLDDDDVFAVGDCSTVLEHRREKAGVFAVRQGPPLTDNLRRRAAGEAARPFLPQRRFLTLLALGDRRAIAARGPLAAAGAWAWHWKDHIDRVFMDRFNVLPAMAADSAAAMRCGGCAAKVGPVTLARALGRLGAGSGPDGTGDGPGDGPRDDAAVIDTGGGALRLESVDFFRAIWPELYLQGEIAAAHAMSDIFAMGGRPDRALAIAVLPYAHPRRSEDDLFQLMAGARAAFDREGVALVGGHTSEGAELSLGFFVSGAVPAGGRLTRKSGLRPGDRLLLTKPIGTGILFAAWMRRLASAPDVMAAIAGMRVSNAAAARILAGHGVTAATDVTGFGLAGHLIEMLDASNVAAEISLAAVPLHAGARDLAARGIVSTLLAENTALADRLVPGPHADTVAQALLFDPQTSGGLLAGVPAAAAAACLAALRTSGHTAAVIGTVTEARALDGQPRRRLTVG